MFKIDEFDEKILKIVSANNRTPAEKIAAEIGLSTSAVQRRLKRLRKEKIIQADVSIVSPAVGGKMITALVGVTLEKENATILNDFTSKIRSAPEVVEGFYVTGEIDFLLVVSVSEMPEFENFARRFLTGNPHVKRYNTNIVISEVKTRFEFSSTGAV